MQPTITKSTFHNPKIHSDLLSLYTQFFAVHKNMPKYLRIAILEPEILGTISKMMSITIHINVMKAAASKPNLSDVLSKIHELRSLIENIKAFTTLLWKLQALTQGFFLQVSSQTEEISKQIVGWERYLSSPKNNQNA